MSEDRPEPAEVRIEDLGGDERTHRFRVCGEHHDIDFAVVAEEQNGDRGWGVQIDGLPDPPIVHSSPWDSLDAARDAAVSAIQDILTLERMQQEDMKESAP